MKKIFALLSIILMLAISTVSADYSMKNVKLFKSFEDYSIEFTTRAGNNEPNGFVALFDTYSANKGVHRDMERNSNTLRLGFNAESVLKLGEIVDSGKLHISYDFYQGYDDNNPLSKAKSLWLLLSRNTSQSFSIGNIDGQIVNSNAWYDQYNPNALAHGEVQTILNHGQIKSWNETDGTPIERGDIYYMKGAKSWGQTEAYDPNIDIDYRKWYKVDVILDKDNNTYDAYINGVPLEGYTYSSGTGEYGTDKLEKTLSDEAAYDAIKGVTFRVESSKYQGTGNRYSSWHIENGGFYLLDNVYAKNYDGEYDIISLNSDDMSGNGVALQNGKLNVAFSEFMSRPAEKSDVVITNTITREEVTDFEITNSDEMQFCINFGNTALEAGSYKVTVNNIDGAISGQSVTVPAYFDTAAQGNLPWVTGVNYLRYDGVAQETSNITSATSGVEVCFSKPVNIDEGTASGYVSLTNNGVSVQISRYEVSDDKTKLRIYPQGMFIPGEDYALEILGSIVSLADGNLNIVNKDGIAYSDDISVMDDAKCVTSYEFNKDTDTGNADFKLTVVKTDASDYKVTMAVATYENREDGAVYMKNIKYLPVCLGSSDRINTSYTIENVSFGANDKVKAFVWRYPDFVNLYNAEK